MLFTSDPMPQCFCICVGCHLQVFEVSPRELGVCNHLDLPLALLAYLHDVAKVSDAAIDLDLVMEELLEGGDVEDLVGGGLRSVDYELCRISYQCILEWLKTGSRSG